MKKIKVPKLLEKKGRLIFLLLLFINFVGISQDMRVKVLGGAIVTQGATIRISAGNDIKFQITNIRGDCGVLKVESIAVDNGNFSVSNESLPISIKSRSCKNGKKYTNFTIKNNGLDCNNSETIVTIKNNRDSPNFWFKVIVDTAPIISVFGGNPSSTINNGISAPSSNTPSSITGTYFGIKEDGSTESRRYYIFNTGSCSLEVSDIESSLPDFTIGTIRLQNGSITSLSTSINPGSFIYFDVIFTASGVAGTRISIISITNNDTTFNFNVSAEVFNFNIPGPGGVTADFRLWLKSTRGIVENSSKVSVWKDLGSNAKNAKQDNISNQPAFKDDITSNINFNPVVKFENSGLTEQYLFNEINGFYNQEIFIVVIPDNPISNSSTGNTIFSGISTGEAGDITGVGFGNYTSRFSNEVLSYAQGTNTSFGISTNNSTYSNVGIINARNNSYSPPTGMELLYNSDLLSCSMVKPGLFKNVGTLSGETILGTKYWIGRNFDRKGSLNGRVAEIMTFSERVPDADRLKIESYLAIKYGITLGEGLEAEKDYIISNGAKIWDHTLNTGFNFNIAGIGRDDKSDLNQKQSKSSNNIDVITMGLGSIAATNSANTNEFSNDVNLLVWGSNNSSLSKVGGEKIYQLENSPNVEIKYWNMGRTWKVAETGGDIPEVYISIPKNTLEAKLDGAKDIDKECVLIVGSTSNFDDPSNIIDMIPLKLDASGSNYQTWYDFDGVKFFTIGVAPLKKQSRNINISNGDYLVGEREMNLNYNSFTVSAWVRKVNSSTATRNVMAKGDKMQMRLNSSNQIEIVLDDDSTASITSNMELNDSKWHHITFVYESGTIFLYVDGILDKSIQNVEPPTPNFNRFSIGVLYNNKNKIINPFLGEIDEVYIWSQAFNQDQIRFLMNQEIRKGQNGGESVKGKEIPQTISKNEVDTIPWEKLIIYFDFNSFCGSTVEGVAATRDFMRINYLKTNKDKSIIGQQTCPTPYISAKSGSWTNETTWVNGNVQTIPSSIGLDGNSTVGWNIVKTSHDLTIDTFNSMGREIELLGLMVDSNKLQLNGSTSSGTGNGLTISHYLKLDGTIDLEGESQLIQTIDSDLDPTSFGKIERDQQGEGNFYRYNDWSSPVIMNGSGNVSSTGTPNSGTPFTVFNVLKDGANPVNPVDINFVGGYDGDNTTTPIKIAEYWIYKYANDLRSNYSKWDQIKSTGVLLPGEGFLMKGTKNPNPDPNLSDQNYVFVGKPNNGTITLPIAIDNDYLVGNPYPSAIDADQFLWDNRATILGTLYFWEHYGADSHILREYKAGYGAYNLSGGVGVGFGSGTSTIKDPNVDQTNPVSPKTPKRYIPIGQGFFVQGNSAGGTIEFNNGQRIFVKEDVTSSVFMKSNSTKIKKSIKKENEFIDKRFKIRVGFETSKVNHRELLLTFDERASDGIDWGFEGEIYDLLDDDMYWSIEEQKYVIQATSAFRLNKKIPLGIQTSVDGDVLIKLDALENAPENTSVYIKDKSNGETFEITNNPFEINLGAGEYNDRFVLTFQPRLKTLQEIELSKGVTIFMNNDASELHVNKIVDTDILEVNLFNYLGQNVKTLKAENSNRDLVFSLSLSSGVYIVKVVTSDGALTKKIIVEKI